jgi:Leucine rich repeat/Leucine Rich Repeat
MKTYAIVISVALRLFVSLLFFDSGRPALAQGMASQIPPSEYTALVDLFNSTDGASWLNNSGWTNPLAATWNGVIVLNSHVAYVDLNDNQLTGTIPASLNNLSQLQSLDLSDNKLNGSIPTNWSNLTQLQGLYLDLNKLTGRIPRSLTNLPLLYLDLSFNQLTGRIPEGIGNWGQAQSIDFSFNQLCGCIPCGLTNCTQLTYFSVAGDRLDGAIPEGVGYLRQLEQLDVSYNRLKGFIPFSLAGCTNLTFLNLAGNQLTGPIPDVLGNPTQLQELYLSQNWLGGGIPTSLGNLANLKVLLLDYNHFTGVVPDFTEFQGVYIGLTENYFNLPTNSQSLGNINAMIAAGNTVNYSPQNPSPLLGPLRYTYGGSVQVSLIGLDAQYMIQKSFDLKNWSNLGYATISNNAGLFEETPSNPQLPGFYRAAISTSF